MASRFGGAHCDRDAKRPETGESRAIKRGCTNGVRRAQAVPGCMEPIDAHPEPIAMLHEPQAIVSEPIPSLVEPIPPRREPQWSDSGTALGVRAGAGRSSQMRVGPMNGAETQGARRFFTPCLSRRPEGLSFAETDAPVLAGHPERRR
jgi:hypothetical protein